MYENFRHTHGSGSGAGKQKAMTVTAKVSDLTSDITTRISSFSATDPF